MPVLAKHMSVSHDPSEIILIFWFTTQETFLKIINVENSCAASYLYSMYIICSLQSSAVSLFSQYGCQCCKCALGSCSSLCCKDCGVSLRALALSGTQLWARREMSAADAGREREEREATDQQNNKHDNCETKQCLCLAQLSVKNTTESSKNLILEDSCHF